MKLTLTILLLTTSLFAVIPEGTYKLEKIECTTGKVLKLGGKFMVYDIFLDVTDKDMMMTATAKAGSWAPFKLNCTQVNKGSFTYTALNKYEGDLPNVSVSCNASVWSAILKKQLFGVEEYGEFTYSVNGNKLTIENPNTITKYSCKKTGGYPVYHYTKL